MQQRRHFLTLLDLSPEEFRNIIAARFPAFNKEDIGVVEGLQRNFESSAFNYAHFLEVCDDNVK